MLAAKVSKVFLAIGELSQFRHLNETMVSDAEDVDSDRGALVNTL